MLRYLIPILALFLAGATLTRAETPSFREGVDYAALNPPQPTQDTDKIEVIEFFWYGCPHCYSFEPHLKKWLETKPDDVQFIREPAAFNKTWAAHARAYYTAEALGIAEKTHTAFFDAIQNQKRALKTENELAEFFAEFGVDKKSFLKAYNSFIVHTKSKRADSLAPRYGVTGVPTLIVNGKYVITGRLAKNYPNMIAILNHLTEQERADKRK